MIFPTLKGFVHKSGGYDVHGQPKPGVVRPFMFAPVKLKFSDQHTTVRTDSAGSHGSALETVADVVILVRPEVDAQLADVLTIVGHKVKVSAKHPRFTPGGRLDHYQLDCVAEA